jgi:hypothetical protein
MSLPGSASGAFAGDRKEGPNLLLQIVDLPAEGRLRYAQPGSSPADVHFFGGGNEIAQVA